MKNHDLFKLLGSYYGMYIKLHSYHWNVVDPNFMTIHTMLQGQYEKVAQDIDEIAERIRMLGDKVPASFQKFNSVSIVGDPDENFSANEMLKDLYKDGGKLIQLIEQLLEQYKDDHITVDLLTQKLSDRKKILWFLESSIS